MRDIRILPRSLRLLRRLVEIESGGGVFRLLRLGGFLFVVFLLDFRLDSLELLRFAVRDVVRDDAERIRPVDDFNGLDAGGVGEVRREVEELDALVHVGVAVGIDERFDVRDAQEGDFPACRLAEDAAVVD